jgi:plasmid stabilization system protein ParE
LGHEFATEVAAAFERILQYPNAWAPFSGTTRRCQVHRFPYGVLYHLQSDEIVVMAIMHLARDPQRWQDRLRDCR